MTAPQRRPAVLLMGPPGAGKSPLGEALERRTGWVHFDFGAQLRRIASGANDHGLAPAERNFVRGLVEADALFPEDWFALAHRIAADFLDRNKAAPGFVLNGLPRRADQARGLVDLFAVTLVVVLDCPADVAASRVARRRAGGTLDHAGRQDDAPERLAHRCALYDRHAGELCAHYRSTGVAVLTLPVGEDSTAENLAQAALATARLPGGP